MLNLFCDGSVNPQEKIGFGAYFLFEEKKNSINEIDIKIKKFINTSSTKLELEVLLWALEDENLLNEEIRIFTDCQNILNLKNRREKLEKNGYYSSNAKLVNNSELYKKFYIVIDKLNCNFVKIKGHKKSSLKDDTDNLFNLVDKASRKALREYLKKQES